MTKSPQTRKPIDSGQTQIKQDQIKNLPLLKQGARPITISHRQNFDIFLKLAQGLNQSLSDQGVIFNYEQFEHGVGCNQGYYWPALYH